MSPERWIVALGLDAPRRAARLSFLELSDEDRAQLAELGRALEPHLAELVDRWHAYLLERPETRQLMRKGRVQEHLRQVQTRYFATLLRGPYDEAYFEERLRIGFVHERVGLEPAWYMGSYRKFVDLVRQLLLNEGHPAAQVLAWTAALEKVVHLDMVLALDAYFHTGRAALVAANTQLDRLARELEARNRELTRQFAKAQEAARIKEQLLSRVSHELRTPLNAIIGFADLLADGIEGPVTPAQERSLRKVRAHGERLLAMIDEMIDASKMAVSGIGGPRPFAPEPVLRRVAQGGERSARAKGLAFHLRLASPLPEVSGDAEGFALALEHVVSNAVKFTERGQVTLDARPVGDVLRCTVSDTGPGVPEADRFRIFEPFHQAGEGGDTRVATGLGIGLTLARQALERMGGRLELAETGPGGSVFVLDVPLAGPSRG
ncbi:MAG: hypothetical protein Kow0092_18330 [Deferrisomatales bacterium]